jgi:acetamidase/formamidase
MIRHVFTPTTYHTTIGGHTPVLTIRPGDRVVTTTVDAAGGDENGVQVTERGNPMTGPFFVEGAEPGDRLVMHIERITPNRASGWTTQTLASNVVDPGYVAELFQQPKGQPRELAIWDLDVEAGTATLRTPHTRLGSLALPLDPMLGCFGVAPHGGQSISTATAGPHGGNMDYRGFRAGATVYLPVEVPGALFFLGDGHAVQGDGEIGGTGIEVSMEVEFSVDLLKDKPSEWPRGEDAECIFTVGNARPLDQALQHATTEMMRWLEEDYGLDAHSAGILLGQTVEYAVGNVFDPAYTMVCKVSKQVLGRLK